MSRARMQLTIAALFVGLTAGSALAASTALEQYPNAEDQIKNYFRQNSGQANANCGAGEIHDISDAEVVSDTPSQLTLKVDYTFSAKSLQNTATCSGTQSSTVTFDKSSDGKLAINNMAGLNP